MILLAACVAAAGTYLAVAGAKPALLSDRIGRYLLPSRRETPVTAQAGDALAPAARAAGFTWTTGELRLRRAGAAVTGCLIGILLAQGDLFVTGSTNSLLPLAALGAGAGLLALNMALSTRSERRRARLGLELPVAADAIALHVVAGDSVAAAIERFTVATEGIVTAELAAALTAYHGGKGLHEALQDAARTTVGPAASRLYTLLGSAHLTGGRLTEALTALAVDFRAATGRELTAESGRRALATYGPILALMVPATLLFLMYPTLTGLADLATGR